MAWKSDEFGERLRKLIEGAGYPSMMQFCLNHGIAPPDLYRWLNGRAPSPEGILRLSLALNMKPAMVAWGKDGGVAERERYKTTELAKAFPRMKVTPGIAKAIGAVALLGVIAGAAPVRAEARPLPLDGEQTTLGIMSTPRRRRLPPLVARAA